MKNTHYTDTILNFEEGRKKHIHHIHEKKLQEMNKAFENAFPLAKNKKTNKKNKSKKK